jgi:ribosome-associated toxin RatA of RatAB toxin-antitoxin module
MSVLRGTCSAEVEAGIERCWALVQDVARWPQWQRTLERVEVVEADDQGRPLICDTVSDAKLTKVHCRARMRYEEPRRIAWSLVESDDLDSMEGSWELEDLGAGRTRVTYSLAVDPGPIGILARPIERMIRPLVMGHQADELAAALAGPS